jgi:hypothetical protein
MTWANPEQGVLTIHGYEERRWRHLDTMQFETIFEVRVPGVRMLDGARAVEGLHFRPVCSVTHAPGPNSSTLPTAAFRSGNG